MGHFTDRLSAEQRANAQATSIAAHKHLHWPWLFVVLYSFLPVSSDPVFVAVGMGALPMRSSTIAFFLARSVFNTFMVTASRPVVSSVTDLFAGRFGWISALVVVGAVGGYLLFLKLPWTRWRGIGSTRASSSSRTSAP